jgi:hypothetical protein
MTEMQTDCAQHISMLEQQVADLIEDSLEAQQLKVKLRDKTIDMLLRMQFQIDKLHEAIDEMNETIDEIKETNRIQEEIISKKDNTILILRGLLHDILKKNNKDAERVDEILDKDLEEYEDEVIEAFELLTE